MRLTSPDELPQKPGVYIMHNSDDEIIYVGKAKKLKNRVQSYFRDEDKLDRPKTQVLMRHFAYLEYILTDTEKEEQRLLRQEFLAEIRADVRASLESIEFVEETVETVETTSEFLS